MVKVSQDVDANVDEKTKKTYLHNDNYLYTTDLSIDSKFSSVLRQNESIYYTLHTRLLVTT